MNMYVKRLLVTDELPGSNISKSLTVGESIDFIYAGITTIDTDPNYSSAPGHPKGGFYGRM